MVAVRIPGTEKIIFVNEHIGDIVINMADHPDVSSSIREEDIKIVGDWEDYYSSGTIGPQEAMLQNIQNIDPGTLLGQVIQGDRQRTDRGKLASTKRTRPKLVYIDLIKND